MIQRSLLRQSQALRATTARPFAVSPFQYYSKPPRICPSSRPQTLASRYYSSTSSQNSSTESESSSTETDPSSRQQETHDPHKQALEVKDREIIDLKDRYLRSVAEFRNLQERTKRDIQSARDFAITRFAKDLIDSVDNLDRALSTVSPSSNSSPSTSSSESQPSSSTTETKAQTDLQNLYNGLVMTSNILMATLKKHGLERFDPSVEGGKFDPNLHEATFQTKVEGKEDGTVFHTQQTGFMLNGRVVRAAKVGVVKNS